jgi:7-cyano-7-deazaguanine reductase
MTDTLPLGRHVSYPDAYDPSLLYPIDRAAGRAALGLRAPLPFVGHDRWHAYELGWLDPRGKPMVATATFVVPADSPCMVESKSLKLYLNSFNGTRMASADALRACIADDLSRVAGAAVDVAFGLPGVMREAGIAIDDLDCDIDAYGPPDPRHLRLAQDQADLTAPCDEVLVSELLRSNCPVTGQPDWASLRVAYRGARIDRVGLLHYIASFRDHAEFHEQCVERMFVDLMARCAPQALAVEARYTRRGGLDINPLRATPGMPAMRSGRDERQ